MDATLSTGLRAKLLGWLPPGSASRSFLAAFVIDSIGTGLFLGSSALFFTRVVGLTIWQVGLGLSLSGVAGLLCSVPLGRLADRFGSRRMIVIVYVWRGLGFVAYLFVGSFPTFVLVACFLGSCEWASGPLVQATVAAAQPADSRVRTMATVNALRNAGFTIGALLATLAVASGSTAAYRGLVLADAVSFFAAALVLARIRLPGAPRSGRHEGKPTVRVRDPKYLFLAACNGVLFLHAVILTVGLPLWIVTRTHAPAAIVGALVMINTVLAIAFGLLLSRGAEGMRAGATRQHRAGWYLAACCVLIGVTRGLGPVPACVLLVGAAVALTLGEVSQSVGGYGLSYALAPEDRRGYFLSVYYLGEPCTVILGPAVLTIAVISAGSVGWLVLGGVFAATGVAVRTLAAGTSERNEMSMREEIQCAS